MNADKIKTKPAAKRGKREEFILFRLLCLFVTNALLSYSRSSAFIRGCSSSVHHDARSESVNVGGLAGKRDICEWTGNAFRLAVPGKYRVIVKLKDANINSLAGANIQTTSQLHRKVCRSIFDREVKLGKEIEGLLLPVRVTRHTCERVSKRLYAACLAIVLNLHATQEIV